LARESIEAPLTGKILSVDVKVGDKVNEGDQLCILESMKMENPIVATVSGTVVQVGVTPDKVVKTGDMIAIIEY
jgi:biotin carboxyl carrier protein